MKRYNLRLSRMVCIALLPMAALFYTSVGSYTLQRENIQKPLRPDQTKHPKVIIEPQKFSPLILSLEKNTITDTKEPQIELVIKNVSDKAIRAYAIRYEIQFEVQSTEGAKLTNIHDLKKTMRPGESRIKTIDGFPSNGTPVTKLVFAVDYVEFVDDSFWGEDVNQFAEYLRGQRAGAKYESTYLLELVNSKGGLAMKNSLKSEKQPVNLTESRSTSWLKGFSDGRDFIRVRLQHKLDAGEVFDLKSELQKPFDASGKE